MIVFPLQLPDGVDRKMIQEKLKSYGIPTNIYYIKLMHKQGAFSDTISALSECPVTDKLCECVLCLPIHPYLDEDEADYIIDKLISLISG